MPQIEAIDMFVESDPSSGDGDDGISLISLRTPTDREFAHRIKELGAKWDDQSKEWQIYGGDDMIKQIGSLCKTAFPQLPRRRNRLITTQVTTRQGSKENGQLELIVRLEFVVNRTIKTYRWSQNLKWFKEFKQVIELPADDSKIADLLSDFAVRLRPEIRILEQTASEAFEALLIGRREAVNVILQEAGISQT